MSSIAPSRAACVYLSPEKAIIAALHYTSENIHYEQSNAVMVKSWRGGSEMSSALKVALKLFSFRDENLRDRKLKDWPGYIASGMRSTSQFQRLYQRVWISSVNDSESLYSAEAEPPGEQNIVLKTMLNPYSGDDAFGEPLERLFELCCRWEVLLG